MGTLLDAARGGGICARRHVARDPPWYLERDYRRRSTYALATVVCAIAGSLAVRAGWAAYNDPLGLFYRSPWASGTGLVIGIEFFLTGVVCLALAVLHRHSPSPLQRLVASTLFGGLVIPSPADHDAAFKPIPIEEELT